MPCYRQHIIGNPYVTADKFAQLFKSLSKTVLKNGGSVRVIENHGIRPMPERARRKYQTTAGDRWFWNGKFMSVIFDASPDCLKETERVLRADEGIIRFQTIKINTATDRFFCKNYRNPYMFNEPPPKDLDY